MNILDLINNLRNEDDEDLIIQCDVFDDEKQSDDEELAVLNPACVDINDHKEVFNALYHKVRLQHPLLQHLPPPPPLKVILF